MTTREITNKENPNNRSTTSTILRTNHVISSYYKIVLVGHETKRNKYTYSFFRGAI